MPDNSNDFRDLPVAMIHFAECEEDEIAFDKLRAEYSAKRRAVARFLNGRLRIHVGDLTDQNVDVIINAANTSLTGGRGADCTIQLKSEAQLAAAYATLCQTTHPDGLATGEAVITCGRNLPVEFLIHTVGPVYGQHQGREAELLAACYRNSLALAKENELMKVAFPPISMGESGYPPAEAAKIVYATMSEVFADDNLLIDVRMVFSRREEADVFIAEMHRADDSN